MFPRRAPLPHTHTQNSVYKLHSSSRWRPDHNSQLHFTNIAQPYIPFYTAAPRTLRNTHTFLYFFRKTNFQNFFRPFPGDPRDFAHHFRITLLPLYNLKFFATFRPLFSLPSSGYPPPDDRHAPSTNRGDQPTARRPYMAKILYYTLNFTSTVSPSP